MGNIFYWYKNSKLLKTIEIQCINEEGIYCLAPLNDNLFICGGNLLTIDIYYVNSYEKIASTSVKDLFIFDIKYAGEGHFFLWLKKCIYVSFKWF